jgi:hypothetical protein
LRAYIDFCPPDYVHHVMPEPLSIVDAYVVLDCFDFEGHDDAGIAVLSFAIEIDPGTSLSTSYESLLPGGLVLGDWETGVSLSATECVMPDGSVPGNNGIVPVAKVTMIYSGTPGDIIIGNHPHWPRSAVDCTLTEEGTYRLLSNGGIGQLPSMPGDPGADVCGGSVAVEHHSWGAIKALFR